MVNNNDGNENRNINVGGSNYSERIRGDYIEQQIINNPFPEKPFKPIKYIPKIGSANFIGRQDDLVKVHEELYEQNNRVAISAVSGMGGVGKTELAIQYANRYNDNYPGGICWLNARDGNVESEIIQFVQLEMGLEVPQKDARENALTLEQQVAWCWGNWRPPEGLVLVVLDDVTEYKDIEKLLPRTDSKRFKLLITTRLRNLDSNFVSLPLDVLSEDEALSLLRGILGEQRVDKELETAKDLCEWLGYLPLGLELVARYLLEDPDLSIAQMLEELEQERLENQAIDPSPEELEYTNITANLGVRAAFNLTWERLDSKTKEVGELLSLFDPNAIAWKYVDSVTDSLNWSKKDVREGKKQLYQRHLIKRLEQGEANYQIHRLIHEFLGSKLQASTQIQELEQAFTSTFIEVARTIPQVTTLEIINRVQSAIPHLTQVAKNHLDGLNDTNLFSVFLGLGWFYQGQGLYTLAQPWLEQCVSEIKSRLGENHPNYADSLNNLGYLYYFQGKYPEAEPLYTQALDIRKQLLGENHPDYATSLNNLGLLYHNQGKYDRAEPLYTQALELRKRILGENHPDTAQSLNNLALLYKDQGKYQEAEPLVIQALEITKLQLGVNHPDTAGSLNNLALLYYNQGKYVEAEPLYIQALEIRKLQLGVNHPQTASSLNNLANLYKNQGKYVEAEPLYIQALEIRKLQLGVNHPDTASSLNNLALLYDDQGKYVEAEPLYIQALEIRKLQLGVNHPDTAGSLNNLALIYSEPSRYAEAEPLYLQALELRKRLLGENHPHTATSLNNLAALYESQGRYVEAEPLYQQALELRERLLGKNHPDVATSLNNLATLYLEQTRYTEAESLLKQALELYKQLLGEEHPGLVIGLNNLALLYKQQGRYEESEPLYLQALEIAQRKLGVDHPNTITLRENLQKLRDNR